MDHSITWVTVSACLVLACSPALASEIPNPLANAKEGQWVLEKATAAGMTNYMYKWISRVDGKKVTLRTQVLNEDKETAKMPAQEATVDLGASGSMGGMPGGGGHPGATITDDEIEVAGRTVACKKIEVVTGPVTSTSWMSAEVPVSGIVRAVSVQGGNEVSRSEVVDYGESGGEDKPAGTPTMPGMPGGMTAGMPGMAGGAGGPATGKVPGTPPGSDESFAVGDPVAGLWKSRDGTKQAWYLAKVIAVTGGDYALEWGDGELGKVSGDRLRKLGSGTSFAIGDQVMAAWNNKPRMYEGEVQETLGDEVVVKWADGDTPSPVPNDQVFKR